MFTRIFFRKGPKVFFNELLKRNNDTVHGEHQWVIRIGVIPYRRVKQNSSWGNWVVIQNKEMLAWIRSTQTSTCRVIEHRRRQRPINHLLDQISQRIKTFIAGGNGCDAGDERSEVRMTTEDGDPTTVWPYIYTMWTVGSAIYVHIGPEVAE